MPFLQNPEPAENLADDASDRGLSRARIADEHHVQTQSRLRQPGLRAVLLQPQEVRQRLDFPLDCLESNQPVQFRFRLGEEFFGRRLGPSQLSGR